MREGLRQAIFSIWGIWLLSVVGYAQEIEIKQLTVDANGIAQVEISSSEEFYYVLKVRNRENEPFDHFTTMALGINGSVTLKESVGKYPLAHYQVHAIKRSQPADSDRDGFDDLTEFLNPVNQAPFNAAKQINFRDGAVQIPNREVFKRLSYQGADAATIDPHLKELEFVKFYIVGDKPETAQLYFMNSNTHATHAGFKLATRINAVPGFGEIPLELKGEIIYHPNVQSANGTYGVYRFEFEPNDGFSFQKVQMAFELIAANMPFLKNNLSYYPMPNAALPLYQEEKAQYDLSRIPILLEQDLFADIDYMALNQTTGYGFLRKMEFADIPGIRDIVIYENLPNEMPRIGGIISAVPQTPLSHVNLRAIQDKVPNAYIKNPSEDDRIVRLIGKYVRYVVKQNEFTLEESSQEVVNAWFDALRPKENQIPPLDLSRTKITKLDDIRFHMSDSFGAKCANVAEMRTFGFDLQTVPDGFGIPFYYYRTFMEHNGFFDRMKQLRASSSFVNDATVRSKELQIFRKEIEKGDMPPWMLEELAAMQKAFPEGTSIRCRSSTNNEDLLDFSGAGLYDSKTQKPGEGHISKSIRQVFASMWNFRAYDEREFYRIDHFAASMGVLCHPNEKDELLNGVGVSADPIYYTDQTLYLNSQIGEDLVTNPEALSIPEEIMLDAGAKTQDHFTVIRFSNLSNSKMIFDKKYMGQMRNHLKIIHNRFKKLYKAENDTHFAMEIEYKIVKEGYLSIKQARPWLGPNTSSGLNFYEEEGENKSVIHFFAFPNPSEREINLQYECREGGIVKLELYTLSGHEVLDKSLGYKFSGTHRESLHWENLIGTHEIVIAKITLEGENGSYTKSIKIFRK